MCDAQSDDAISLVNAFCSASEIAHSFCSPCAKDDFESHENSEAKDVDSTPTRVPADLLAQSDERSFTCEVCGKGFKRETNLMFHMATHRQQGTGDQQCWNAPVQCSACPKVFATKYQAKKHFLRRHFQGERRFSCARCNMKAFAVKEDLTTHMKTCGRTFACSCGARPRSLAALNKHCAQLGHAPAATVPHPTAATAADPSTCLDYNTASQSESPPSSPSPPPLHDAASFDESFTMSFENDGSDLSRELTEWVDAAGLINLPLGAEFGDVFQYDQDFLAALTTLVA